MAARKKVTKKVSKAGQKSSTIRAKGIKAGAKAAKARTTSATQAAKPAKPKAKTSTVRGASRGKGVVRATPKAAPKRTTGRSAVSAKAARSKAVVSKTKARTAKPAAAAKVVKKADKIASRKVVAAKKKIETAKKLETVKKIETVKKTESGRKAETVQKTQVKAPAPKTALRSVEAGKVEAGKAEAVKVETVKVEPVKAPVREAPKEALSRGMPQGEAKTTEPASERTIAATTQAAGPTGVVAKTAGAPTPSVVMAPAAPPGVPQNAAKAIRPPQPMKTMDREPAGGEQKTMKTSSPKHGFKLNEFVVYPAHGVGQIVAMEEQEVAGFRLELFVINFVKDKMTLRVPISKVAGVGMRKLSDNEGVRRSLEILTGRARIKRTMWSRRAQEYEAKINSGDINAIAEVVRDLFRSEAQPEQSYSERQLYEAALDRMMREVAVVQKLSETEAFKVIDAQLRKNQKRLGKPEASEADVDADPGIEEAA